MKKTQRKDAWKNIWVNKVSWLSILVIALLAAVAYLTIAYSAAALDREAVDYYAQQNMWDLELSSTLLLDGEDLEAIRALPGVEAAEPVWTIAARLRRGGSSEPVVLLSLAEQIAVPELLDGRLPAEEAECLLEKHLADKLGIRVGASVVIDNDTITGLMSDQTKQSVKEGDLASDADALGGDQISVDEESVSVDPVKRKVFTVVGLFNHPDHVSYQVQVTPYMIVKRECFDLSVLEDSFMKARIRIADAPLNRFDQSYLDAVAAVQARLDALGEERAPQRRERILSIYRKQIDEGQAKLDAAARQLDDAQEQIAAGQAKLAEAAEQLGVGKEQLDSGQQGLYDARKLLDQAEEQLKQAKTRMYEVEKILMRGERWILDHITEEDWPPDIGVSYEEFKQMLGQEAATIRRYLYRRSGLQAAMDEAEAANSLYEANRLNWYYSGEEYLDGVTRLENGKKQIEEAERKRAEGQAQYDQASKKLEKAREALNQLGPCRWISLTNEGNSGYIFADTASGNLGSLSLTFSLLFVVVAALVIYSTVGRMVEEQRKLVGATKAMGLYNREILAKYLLFGLSSTLLGVVLGVALSYTALQKTVLKNYGAYFAYGQADQVFLPGKTALVVLGGMALAVLAVWFATARLLRSPAIRLMQGAMPKAAGRKQARSAGSGGLYRRLILLNMRSDLKRVIVTIVSIAGCCILLMIGFTLKYAIGRISDRQFGRIETYDRRLSFEAVDGDESGEALEQALQSRGLRYAKVYYDQLTFKADGKMNACTLVCAEPAALEGFYGFRDAYTHEALTLPDSGVLVPQRMCEVYHTESGTAFTLNDAQLLPHDAVSAAIFENYFSLITACSPTAYQEIFGKPVQDNCFLIQLDGADPEELEQALETLPGFLTMTDAKAELARFTQLSTVLDYVIAALTVMAALMAYFILLNLSNTYIQQKSRELTIMRINGFSTGECVRYASWDLALTTVVGIAVGLTVGAWLGEKVTRMMEQTIFMYVRDPDLRSFLFSLLITALLSVGINAIALRKIPRLKLSDLA